MEFDVTLVCSYVLTIEAETAEEAGALAQKELNSNTPKIHFEVTDVSARP